MEQHTQEHIEQDERVAKALNTLKQYIVSLAVQADQGEEYGEQLWERIRSSQGLLQELAYYHDYGKFLCKYVVEGHTLADALVWQVDHFKLYMDRPEDMNRYRQERLLLSAFETMLQLEKEPELLLRKLGGESGQDRMEERWGQG